MLLSPVPVARCIFFGSRLSMKIPPGMLRKARFLALGVLVVLLVGFIGIRWIAASRGVVETAIPRTSLIHDHLDPTPDYVDSYRCPVPPGTIADIADIERLAFQKGTLTGESGTELVYRAGAPGLVFHISYLLDRPIEPTSIQVSTVVHYESRWGAIYFAFVRPIHKAGVPFIVSQMVRE